MSEKTLKYYLQICEDKAPYPLNYIEYGDHPDSRKRAVLIGMMIDKGYLKL
jgi:hypothetical protein